MKKTVTKKVTIDDLAVMVASGFDRLENRIGNVEHEVVEIKKDIIEVKENLASTRRDVLAMGDKFTLKYELHDLANRVVLLEQKQKAKR